MKNCSNFKCDINITHNPLNLNIEDYLQVALRNNNKRRFLFVSKILGKHIPCRPYDAEHIGKLLAKQCENILLCEDMKDISVISFAETATALGHSVFSYMKAATEFVHTTREDIENVERLEFLEEHSHATEQRMYLQNLNNIKYNQTVILVDDEITTAKTCINFIRQIHKIYPKKKYVICSILNWIDTDRENEVIKIAREIGCKIEFAYLFRGDFEFEIDEKYLSSIQEQGSINLIDQVEDVSSNLDSKKTINHINLNFDEYVGNRDYISYTGRFGINKKQHEKLVDIVYRESKKLNKLLTSKESKVLVLGSEEFMYIPMLCASKMNADVYYHSISRSPIIPLNQAHYPVKSKIALRSFYNKDIANYVYNLDMHKYDECFLFIELKDYKENIKSIVDATNIKKINLVICN